MNKRNKKTVDNNYWKSKWQFYRTKPPTQHTSGMDILINWDRNGIREDPHDNLSWGVVLKDTPLSILPRKLPLYGLVVFIWPTFFLAVLKEMKIKYKKTKQNKNKDSYRTPKYIECRLFLWQLDTKFSYLKILRDVVEVINGPGDF